MRYLIVCTVRKIGTHWPWFNRMTYRPFKGARRGFWYYLPWNRKSYIECAML